MDLSFKYNINMARGWESKAIEDQISAREAEARPALTPAELERRAKREGLLLARSRTASALESAHDERYRALLERTLAHVDSELAALEPPDPRS